MTIRARTRAPGHQRKLVPIAPAPARKGPRGPWMVSCKCGWLGGYHKAKRIAEGHYSTHLITSLPICGGCQEPMTIGRQAKHSPHLCKGCSTERVRAWARRNPEQFERKKRESHLRQKYGITIEQFDAMLAAQDGRCAICLRLPEDPRGYLPHIDHCHQTGRVRGILCGPCNKGIGMFGDNSETVRRAASYLERSNG